MGLLQTELYWGALSYRLFCPVARLTWALLVCSVWSSADGGSTVWLKFSRYQPSPTQLWLLAVTEFAALGWFGRSLAGSRVRAHLSEVPRLLTASRDVL